MEKHKSEDPTTLRAMYYPNLRMYSTHGDTSKHRAPKDAVLSFLFRFGRRAAISLLLYLLSYLPIAGRFVLPAASFYTLNKALGPLPASIIFGSGVFLPRRYLVIFLQSYFSSRSLMRELVGCFPKNFSSFEAKSASSSHTSLEYGLIKSRNVDGFVIVKVYFLGSAWDSTSSSRSLF